MWLFPPVHSLVPAAGQPFTQLPQAVAEAQKPFIENDTTSTAGLGSMTKDRWEKLIGQLQGLGDIPAAIPADACFRNL